MIGQRKNRPDYVELLIKHTTRYSAAVLQLNCLWTAKDYRMLEVYPSVKDSTTTGRRATGGIPQSHYSNHGFGVALAVGAVPDARTTSTVPGRIDSTITSEIKISTLGLS